MIINKIPTRAFVRNTAIAALGCVLGLSLAPSRASADQTAPSLSRLDDKAAALPIAVTFDKVTDAEAGPYLAKLKNTSSDSITVSATVYPSVGVHSDTKEKKLPERTLAAGDTWVISGLAATDKIKVVGKGFADLDIVVP